MNVNDAEFQRLFDRKLASLNQRLHANLGGLVLDIRSASARIGRSMRELNASLEDIRSHIPDYTGRDRAQAPFKLESATLSPPARHLRLVP